MQGSAYNKKSLTATTKYSITAVHIQLSLGLHTFEGRNRRDRKKKGSKKSRKRDEVKENIYHISQPIRRSFFAEKCDLNLTCALCAEGKYYFQTYKYPHIYYTPLYHDCVFSGSDDDFLGFYDE
jgi:hypothetical protein